MAQFQSPWDELKVEELRHLWARGLSAADIARDLGHGITRNSVIGKVNRLGLPMRAEPGPRKPRAKQGKRGRPKNQRAMMFLNIPKKVYEPPKPEPEALLPPAMRKLQLVMLEDAQCHWPVGDPRRGPKGFYFCGVDCDPWVTPRYCRFHLHLSLTPQGRAKHGFR